MAKDGGFSLGEVNGGVNFEKIGLKKGSGGDNRVEFASKETSRDVLRSKKQDSTVQINVVAKVDPQISKKVKKSDDEQNQSEIMNRARESVSKAQKLNKRM